MSKISEMVEKMEKTEIHSQPRRTVPLVTRADTVSDELKARTLAAMERRQRENKRKGLRNVPRLAMVAAITVLTLLVATGAAFALRSWWEDLFEVNQTQTIGGYTVKITKARFANEFLYIDAHSSRDVYLHFEGKVYNDRGDEAEIVSGYDRRLYYDIFTYEADTHTLYVPELRQVVAANDKRYHCELMVSAYDAADLDAQTVFEQLTPDAVFHFNFDICNDYIKSSVKSQSYDVDYQSTLDQVTLDFQKLYVSEVQSTLLAELLIEQNETSDELILPQKIVPQVTVRLRKDDGSYDDGVFFTFGDVLIYQSRYYILLNYMQEHVSEDSTYYEFATLDTAPSYTFELSAMEFQSYRKSNEVKTYMKLDDIDMPVVYAEDGEIYIEIMNQEKDRIELEAGDLHLTMHRFGFERSDISVSESDITDMQEYNIGLLTDIETKSNHNLEMLRPHTVTGQEESYVIVSALSGNDEVMRFKMTDGLIYSEEENGRTVSWNGDMTMPDRFAVSSNPYLYNYAENYYTNNLDGPLPIKFNQDISSLLDPDAEVTMLDFKDLCREFKVDHVKIIALVIYDELYDVIKTRDKSEAVKYYQNGAEVRISWVCDEHSEEYRLYNIMPFHENHMIEAVNPDYYKSKTLGKQSYDQITHAVWCPGMESWLWHAEYYFQPEENQWDADAYTFTVK